MPTAALRAEIEAHTKNTPNAAERTATQEIYAKRKARLDEVDKELKAAEAELEDYVAVKENAVAEANRAFREAKAAYSAASVRREQAASGDSRPRLENAIAELKLTRDAVRRDVEALVSMGASEKKRK